MGGLRPSTAFLFRIETVWVLLPLVFVFWTTAVTPIPTDAWWTIATGRLLVETRSIPATYPFTFPPQSLKFYDSQWLAQLIYYAPYPLFGLEGVVFVAAAIATTTFAVLLFLSWRSSGNIRAASICTLIAGIVAATNLQPRAQTLGFLFFALTLWLLGPPAAVASSPAGHQRWRFVLLFAVEALWANCHGSFFLGPALTTLLVVGSLAQSATWAGWRSAVTQPRTAFLVRAGLLQAAAMFATPFGSDLFTYVARVSGDPTIRTSVTEWQPTSLQTPTGVLFFLSLLATVLLFVLSRRRVQATDALIMLAFGALGVQAVRNVAWWALAIAPILAPYAAGILPSTVSPASTMRQTSPVARVCNAIVVGLLSAIAISALPWIKDSNPLLVPDLRGVVSRHDPQEAAAFLSMHGSCGRVFTLLQWSGYLNWRLWPRCQTMVDAPIEIYPPQVWDDYWDINTGDESWEKLLDRYSVDLLVLSREEQSKLIGQIRQNARWAQIHEDGIAEIFERAYTRGP